MAVTTVRLTEIFYSLQGEANTAGRPTVFVRLTGCPLRCVYCDTEYAFQGGQTIDIDMLVDQVLAYNPSYVTVTGGEPLAQPNCLPLLTKLCDNNLHVSLETSGAMSIDTVDARVSVVMDLKTPTSGELDKNLWQNIKHLKQKDQVKFVIATQEDYAWAKEILDEHSLNDRVSDVLFSPCNIPEGKTEQDCTAMPYQQLADWIIKDNLPVRFQLQLHKLLWADEPGH